MSQFNAFYQPTWNDILGPIQSQLDQQAATSRATAQQVNQRANNGILPGLAAAIRSGLTNLFGGNPQQRAANLGWQIPSSPIQGQQVLPARPQSNNQNRMGKWDQAAVVWGNPQLGYYQPPSWAGWNAPGAQNNTALMNNPFNPMGSNYGGRPRPGAMQDSLFAQGKTGQF